MAFDLLMPALSPTMEKGTLAKWLVAVGDRVSNGDIIAEIETDKATMEIEADKSGEITELLIAAGTDDVPVGAVIARLGTNSPPTEISKRLPAPAEAGPAPSVAPFSPSSVIETPLTCNGDVLATPLVQRLARAKGIDLAKMRGTGANGQITLDDLALEPSPSPAVAIQRRTEPAAWSADPGGEATRLSAMRRTIARRLTDSKREIPHFYLTARCSLDPLLRLRDELNASLDARGMKVSVNDMMMKAMALSMAAVPETNVQFGSDVLHRFDQVDISMAVAVEGGLVTPVLHNLARRSLSSIATEARTVAEQAREGRLAPEAYQGGTASISNLGMFGVEEMIPVINQPQALILGVGAGLKRPWDVEGEVALATVVALTASFDHRAIDGAIAARLMAALREHVEAPSLILC